MQVIAAAIKHRRGEAVAVVCLLLTASASGLMVSPAAATACADFAAVAAADGARTEVASPGFLVVERTESGAPAAQASVDALGASSAYAGHPHPGDAALSGLAFGGVPRGTYPLVAESRYPDSPDKKIETAAVRLVASSAPRSAAATAQSGSSTDGGDGSSAGLMRARATTACAESGAVTAIAESTAEALSFAEGAVRIGRVHSVAKVVIGVDGRPTVESDLEVSQVTVAGQTVAFTDDGLVTGSEPTALPDNPLAEVLTEAGIHITYVAARLQDDGKGVTAPAVRVEVTRAVTGGAPTVTTSTFGRAFAAAGAGPGGAGTVDEATESLAAAPGDSGFSGASAAPTSGLDSPPRSSPDPASLSAPAAAPAPQVDASSAVPVRVARLFSAWSIYAVVVVSSIVLLTGALLFKTLGVRVRWT